MKKKMTVLAVLFLSVAVSFYSVAGTYAKYTSNTTITDSARVAKWGIEFKDSADSVLTAGSENTVDLFAASYLTESTEDAADATDVLSSNGDKVVAPGTRGSYTFKLTGTPETNFTLAYDTTGSTIGDNLKNELLFWIDDEEEASAYNFDTLLTHLAALSTGDVYKSGDLAATGTKQTHTINWKWVFSDGDDASDTTLGNAATPETVTLKVKVTATQSEAAATKAANGTSLS